MQCYDGLPIERLSSRLLVERSPAVESIEERRFLNKIVVKLNCSQFTFRRINEVANIYEQ
jgi:hypothetical protein